MSETFSAVEGMFEANWPVSRYPTPSASNCLPV